MVLQIRLDLLFAMDILPNGFLCPTQRDARNRNTP
jgi:hypothetical protein